MKSSGQPLFPDSIYALSSGNLPSGVAVIRMSGRRVPDALRALGGQLPSSRHALLCTIKGPDGEPIDRGLILYFPAPRSFTGEDCGELHLHGGKAVVAAAMEAISMQDGFRHAEAGEFTKRAFLNGKMDLTSAEAMVDLIAAETEAQRRLALANASGRQKELYDSWRQRLLHNRAMLEAELDFSDEDDVNGSVSDTVWRDLSLMVDELTRHIAGHRAARIVRAGFRVVVAGAPNAGKSSLINVLAQRDVAIVTDVPGTTRDVIETVFDLDGHKVILCDTAGVRTADDMVERIGVDRARLAIEQADLVLHLVGPGDLPDSSICSAAQMCLLVASKADIGDPERPDWSPGLAISAKDGTGIGELLVEIGSAVKAAADLGSEALPTQLRHVSLLERARLHLGNASSVDRHAAELVAEELRLAGDALGVIVGTVGVEDVLGEIFSHFCIGK